MSVRNRLLNSRVGSAGASQMVGAGATRRTADYGKASKPSRTKRGGKPLVNPTMGRRVERKEGLSWRDVLVCVRDGWANKVRVLQRCDGSCFGMVRVSAPWVSAYDIVLSETDILKLLLYGFCSGTLLANGKTPGSMWIYYPAARRIDSELAEAVLERLENPPLP